MAEPENKNAVTHGVYSFRDKGPDSLTEAQKSRYIELRDQFRSEPGRIEYRLELAAHLAMMCDLAWTEIRAKSEAGRNIWDLPVVGKMAMYMNPLIRLMDSWPKNQGANKNILDVMNGEKHE